MCRQNDAGAAAQRSGDFARAFAYFTEAIRLCPRSATYHANRFEESHSLVPQRHPTVNASFWSTCTMLTSRLQNADRLLI